VGLKIKNYIPGKGKIYFSFDNRPRLALEPTKPCTQWTGGGGGGGGADVGDKPACVFI
jgi:hypothetical protein